jgi:hypothetical protein
MSVSLTGPVDYAGVIIQKSQSNRGEALNQLMDALHAAERAQAKPLSDIAEIKKVDVTA